MVAVQLFAFQNPEASEYIGVKTVTSLVKALRYSSVSRALAALVKRLREPSFSVILPFFATAVSLIVIFRFTSTFGELDVPERFYGQFFFLICLSLLCSYVMPLSSNTIWIVALISFQVFCIVVATLPLGDDPLAKLLLYSVAIGETTHIRKPSSGLLVCAAILAAVVLVQGEVAVWNHTIDRPSLLNTVGVVVLLAAAAGVITYTSSLSKLRRRSESTISRLQSRVNQLIATNLNLQQYALDAQFRAASEERKRITRDIHDTVCYGFSCIIMMINDAMIAADQNDMQLVRSLHEGVRELARESLKNTRISLRLFRGLEGHDKPLTRHIQKLTESFGASTGISVRIQFAGLPSSLIPEMHEAIQRLIQEAMVNSLRHGDCNVIDIIFGITDRELTVSVLDDGKGAVQVTEGIGLSGMRERVESAGGSFFVGGTGIGFSVMARFPLEKVMARGRGV